MTTSNLIFQVFSDTDAVIITRSESKAYQYALGDDLAWITASVLDSIPCDERVYESVEEFAKEFNV